MGQKLLSFFTTELQHFFDRFPQVRDALLAGFTLAVSFRKLHAGRSETRFAIERAIMQNHGDIHGKNMMAGAHRVKCSCVRLWKKRTAEEAENTEVHIPH